MGKLVAMVTAGCLVAASALPACTFGGELVSYNTAAETSSVLFLLGLSCEGVITEASSEAASLFLLYHYPEFTGARS